jgi:hypothetical protein
MASTVVSPNTGFDSSFGPSQYIHQPVAAMQLRHRREQVASLFILRQQKWRQYKGLQTHPIQWNIRSFLVPVVRLSTVLREPPNPRPCGASLDGASLEKLVSLKVHKAFKYTTARDSTVVFLNTGFGSSFGPSQCTCQPVAAMQPQLRQEQVASLCLATTYKWRQYKGLQTRSLKGEILPSSFAQRGSPSFVLHEPSNP